VADLARLRQCFLVAARMRQWSEAEQAEIGAEIGAVLQAGDAEAIAAWLQHLEEASGLAHLGQCCRAAEARIRAAWAAERELERGRAS
jgi:hypothetical protein